MLTRSFSALVAIAVLALVGCSTTSQSTLIPTSGSLVPVRANKASVVETVIHSFGCANGSTCDGARPNAGLIDVNGTLYGTTPLGGAHLGGTVFKITTGGVETVLYSFAGCSGSKCDGFGPEAGLIDVNGTFYGTTVEGGRPRNYDLTAGTVFSVTTGGTEKVLYRFVECYSGSQCDGANPRAALTNVNGTLYGTTGAGGNHDFRNDQYGFGTVFSVTTSGAETVLHRFGGNGDGRYPTAGLVDVDGTLYGTTSRGGIHDGTVFAITPHGAETVLYKFKSDRSPLAGLIDVNGMLYGTTVYGGVHGDGTVFKITTGGVETVLYSFAGRGDGAEPYSGLIDVNGTLYGTTSLGGTNNEGTVFSVTTSGKETVLHSFGGSEDGAYPQAGLRNVKGTLYGTTVYGGAHMQGTVFSLTGF